MKVKVNCLYCRHLAQKSEQEPCNSCKSGDKFELQKPKVKKYKLKMSRKRMNKIQEFICGECANQDVLKARPKDIETKKYCDDCDFNLDRYIVKE